MSKTNLKFGDKVNFRVEMDVDGLTPSIATVTGVEFNIDAGRTLIEVTFISGDFCFFEEEDLVILRKGA